MYQAAIPHAHKLTIQQVAVVLLKQHIFSIQTHSSLCIANRQSTKFDNLRNKDANINSATCIAD